MSTPSIQLVSAPSAIFRASTDRCCKRAKWTFTGKERRESRIYPEQSKSAVFFDALHETTKIK
jgi:hypothetical protein